MKPADRLPFVGAFRVNQYCEECSEWQLCPTHDAMKSQEPVDLTPLHMQAMEAAGYCLVECGGSGDCFYHCMLFLARLHMSRLVEKWVNHEHFRTITCEALLKESGRPRMCVDSNCGNEVTFIDYIRMKRGGTKPQSDDATLRNYVQYHKQSYRKVRGKWTNGVYVENEIISAVSFQNDIVIIVAGLLYPGLNVITPNGSYMTCDEEDAAASPFFLWCTGGHYQAFVKISDFEVLATSVASSAFQTSRLLHAKDFRLE